MCLAVYDVDSLAALPTPPAVAAAEPPEPVSGLAVRGVP